jgi:hypothetical protein
MSNTNKLQLRDLVADPATGRLSHTRVWSNVGCLAATALFVKTGWAGDLSSEIWLIYLGSVGGFAAVSKALGLKYQAKQDATGGVQ